VILLLPIAFVLSGLIQAQAPVPAPSRDAQPGDRLPVRRVVLYKSGVGYFEHLGRVRGNQQVTIDFTSGQLDDVLKSLTALDLDGGRITNVGYNSEAGLERRLAALRLPIGEQASRAQFLSALRGARLDVRSATSRWSGRLLSVERIERRTDGVLSYVDTLSLVSDGGDVNTIALDPGVTVRIVEPDLNQEVGRYLTLIGSIRDQDVRRLTIATTGTGDRDLFVSYVSEVPVWKATYRLVLPAAGDTRKPLLQAWAIVDNTVGQDWEGVQLSLVAGAPQSFIQQISRPYYIQRPVVPLPERVLLSPQTHQGAIAMAGQGALTGTVTGRDGPMPGVMVRLVRTGTPASQAMSDASGRYRIGGLAAGDYQVTFTMTGNRTVTRSVSVSTGMETVLNATMEAGNITIDGIASGAGGRGGGGTSFRAASDGFFSTVTPRTDAVSEVTLGERVQNAQIAQQSATTAADMGDLFEYKLKEPVTIRKNQSALVPIASGDVEAEKVSLWTAGSRTTRPLRAIWLRNTTALTLDAGTFSIVEGQAFAGEGLMDSLKAGERRLLSYAMDLALTVDARGDAVPVRVTRVQVSRGLVIQQIEERQVQNYSVRNEDTEPRILVIEHPARSGWKLAGTVEPVETTPAWHRFRLTVAPKTTATIAVDEVRPTQSQYSVAAITDDQVSLLVRERAISPAIESGLREVLKRKAEIAKLAAEIGALESEVETITRDQQRVRENMQALKGSREERDLLQRYVRQLGDQETRLETVRQQLRTLTQARAKAQADLAAFVNGM
jgi:hypothetical protein